MEGWEEVEEGRGRVVAFSKLFQLCRYKTPD